MIRQHGRDFNNITPKNYSRKGLICTCLCTIEVDTIVDKKLIKVVYSVNPTGGDSKPPTTKNGKWKQYWNQSYSNWGTFNEIVELPDIFSKLEDDDYIIEISNFKRDHVMMPFIKKIIIVNLSKYNNLKLKLDRKNKINNINSK